MNNKLKELFFELFYKIIPREINLVEPEQVDYKLIRNLFIDGINAGIYEKDLILDEKMFEYSIRSMLLPNAIPDQYGRAVKTLICTYGNSRIGFLCLAVEKNKKEVELWYFSLSKEYQNLGLGKMLTNKLLNMVDNEYIFFVRCKKNAVAMIKILEKFNFVNRGINKQGYNFYYQDKPLKLGQN